MIQRAFSQLPAVYHAVHRATWLHVLVILAAGAALRWPLLALAPFFTNDGRCCYYHYAVHQFLAGQPFDSHLHYPPGYAVFLAGVLLTSDLDTAAVAFVQHGLGLASGLLVYFLGRRLFGPLVGLVAALLTVLDVELALYEHAVMSETLFTLLLLCALALVLLRLPGSIWSKVASFGLLVGAATLVRPTGSLLPLVVLLLPGLDSARGAAGASARYTWYRQFWHASRRVRLTLVALAGLGLVVVPMMVWNKRTHGVFALTSSLQRNMLYPIEAAPERLLRGRGGGEPLLGQAKATISHHPTSPWLGPYNRLQDRFHLSDQALNRLLMRVALDFVLADPLAYVGETMRRLPRLLTASETTAVGLVQWGEQQHAIAGGPDQLGVSAYDYEAELVAAQVFDQRTEFLRYSHYAWVLLILAIFAATRYYGRAALFVAVILVTTVVSAGVINAASFPLRYRYPVTWAIYLLAAAGAAGVFSMVRAVLTPSAGRWGGLWPLSPVWPTIRRGQLPVLVALVATAVVLAALAAGHRSFTYRSLETPPVSTLGISEPLLSVQLDRLDWQLSAVQSTPGLVALSLPDHLSFDLVGPEGLVPDGRTDTPLLLTVGHEVPGQVLKFVELGGENVPTWDTTGWYQPLLVIRVDDGEYLSQHTDPRRTSLRLRPGDRLLVLAAVLEQSVAPEQSGVLRLHLGDGSVLSYPVEAEPLVVPRQDTALVLQDWLAQHAAAAARVAIVQREEVRVVEGGNAFSVAPRPVAVSPDDLAAIRKWLHAETLQRHAIQYVWGNSRTLKGEAATAVLDPTRLRPVLLEVYPDEDECPVRWRGLFVVATAAAATAVPLVPLTIPHALAADEFPGLIRFSSMAVAALAPGEATMVQLDVTNRSTQRWYGTCSTRDYPVGVAVEGRRSAEDPWTLVGEALLTDDLPAGATAAVAVEITAPREVGRYELRARLVQRPDRVSPATPATTTFEVGA